MGPSVHQTRARLKDQSSAIFYFVGGTTRAWDGYYLTVIVTGTPLRISVLLRCARVLELAQLAPAIVLLGFGWIGVFVVV